MEEKEPKISKDWSVDEVRLVVADYFKMLNSEMHDQPYSKTTHRSNLIPMLSGRSKGSVEFKHQNISGVLVNLGLPYIEGYKPRCNYQSILASEVQTFLDKNQDFLQNLSKSPVINPEKPDFSIEANFDLVCEVPPENIFLPPATNKPWLSRKPRKIDFAELDAANRRLGKLGEEFVLKFEKFRLIKAGRSDLAQKVVWASQDIGDGLGFDIISFDETNATEKMLEVKTTGLGKFFPFYVTKNEVSCSEDIPEKYKLFRVFNFGRSPRVFTLEGPLSKCCQHEPVLFRAGL